MSAPAVKEPMLQPSVVPARSPSAAVHLVVFAASAVAAFFIYGIFY